MLVLTCTCGSKMKVASDMLGRTRVCTHCRKPVKISEKNTTPVQDTSPGPARRPTRDTGAKERQRIGEMMVTEGLVSREQLDRALTIQSERGGKLVELLIADGALTPQAFVGFLARQPGVASIDLAYYHIPPEIISLIPKGMAAEHEVFPIDKMGKLLTLGMACPLDARTIRQIEEMTGLRVKALLCSPTDIRNAIRRYYPADAADFVDSVPGLRTGRQISGPARADAPRAESALKFSNVSRLIQELKSLPALPDTVERVRNAMTDLSISPKDVADTIVKDPPIAAKVLSVANSAAYGFPNRVDSVDLAVALMGLRETYTIVLSAAILNLFEKGKQLSYKQYWEEAMNGAAACKIISRRRLPSQSRGLFTAGLLHDIGRIALIETVPELYAKVSPNLTGMELIDAEQDIVGLSHAEAGFELAANWNLPGEIAEPIRFHHQPEFASEYAENVAIVGIAETWTRTAALRELSADEAMREAVPMLDVLQLGADETLSLYEEINGLEKVRFEWTMRVAAS